MESILRKFTEGGIPGNINQYCHPLCFELAGKRLDFVMDDGYGYYIDVKDAGVLEWGFEGGAHGTARYQCLKADEYTYLLHYQLDDVSPRVAHTFVIDIEQRLVTRIIASMGHHPKLPFLVKTEFEFGAIHVDGKDLPFKRHGFTSDMIGTSVNWNYGGTMSKIHVYYCANFYRVASAPDEDRSSDVGALTDALHEAVAALPSADEPAYYIKIKEGMYLVSITESNMERLLGGKMPYRSNTMCFLQNYRHLYQVGRAFGTTQQAGVENPETNLMFSAYGKFMRADESYYTDPNPYIV